LNNSFIDGQNYFCRMRIAINLGNKFQDNGYISALIFILARSQNVHQFLWLMDDGQEVKDIPDNVKVKVLSSHSDNLLKKRWGLDVQLPSILKKWKADVLLNVDSSGSMTTKVPQVMYVSDLVHLHYPKEYTWTELILLKFYFPRHLRRSAKIITPSNFIKQEVIKQFQVQANRIQVVSKSVKPLFSILDWEARNAVKDGYADGREYFLFVGGFEPVKNLMTVLKAFSQFKKWQHSDMKLLITGNMTINLEMPQKIQTFKFKDDVEVLGHVSDQQLGKIMAGAYVLLYPSLYEGFGLSILEAMQAGTPVITSNNSGMQETGGDAVLYVDPTIEGELSDQMIKLYKDEALRERLIEAGKAQAPKYDEQSSVNSLWNAIESAATN
jgi:glycosyltransferase involved in cell wall biosynthesis